DRLAWEARNGRARAFDRLAEALLPRVQRWATALVGSPDDADDIAQEVLLKTHRALGSFAFGSRVTTWVYAVARRTAADYHRKHNRRARLISALAMAGLVSGVLLVMDLLGPGKREIRYPLRNLSRAEAADILLDHIPRNNIEGWTENMVWVRGSKHEQEIAAQVLRKHDQDAPQVELRFQIIEADGFTAEDTSIARVETVLRELFRFRGYRLVAEAYVRSKENSEATQTIAAGDGVYRLVVSIGDVLRRDQKASAEITARLFGAGNTSYLETSVHLPAGQTAVLGTARPDPQRAALILAVTPVIR
ncbi:MAG: RNA polymerase sigma factor, partial [Longimicrobiales bacterium]